MLIKTASITPELVEYFDKHADSKSKGNHSSGRLVESWQVGDDVMMRFTFFVDSDHCPAIENLIAYVGKELQK